MNDPYYSIVSGACDRKFNLGCGNKPIAGYINCDFYTTAHADLIFDLNQKFPIDTSDADLIVADNVFEHLDNYLGAIRECHRVLKPGGKLVVSVPYFRSKHAFVDPTHKVFFTLSSFDYFVEGTYNNKNYSFFSESFSSLDIFINKKFDMNFLSRVLNRFIVGRRDRFDRSLLSYIMGIEELTFVLTKGIK